MNAPSSGCPINLTLEVLGDHWSLIVIRDLMFDNRRHARCLYGLPEIHTERTTAGSSETV
jgi:DNA-binding HxlR family transcriptional regulator